MCARRGGLWAGFRDDTGRIKTGRIKIMFALDVWEPNDLNGQSLGPILKFFKFSIAASDCDSFFANSKPERGSCLLSPSLTIRVRGLT